MESSFGGNHIGNVVMVNDLIGMLKKQVLLYNENFVIF